MEPKEAKIVVISFWSAQSSSCVGIKSSERDRYSNTFLIIYKDDLIVHLIDAFYKAGSIGSTTSKTSDLHWNRGVGIWQIMSLGIFIELFYLSVLFMPTALGMLGLLHYVTRKPDKKN